MSCLLAVKVVPGAAVEAVAGWHGAAVKIKLRAPPVEGRANAALRAFLAERLGLARSAVTLERGETARHKLVRLDGVERSAVLARLGLPPGPEPGRDGDGATSCCR